ncbi:helix-turn-helix domain-containing protein [Streptomyces sp. NBC_00378]|uniref:helix-turn-helix domain-containing protein n=1 Tax=unclassified Streptomyces TaxID=2593676 RepID=UPI002258007D|nr:MULTISPECIES: helix-turn-helix domain-containing protein [unclassified Streptomyces]MCX5112194.1 helix-turn-helix domain-containing protein [Streptomyces sp. NBC_00378]MCX5114611.1 helix-turn-helix domain-containing protein [Streptomyces sp. NBC_00378]
MTGSPTVAQRRAQVRQLAQDGASNRAIAAQLGISKDTVRRDLATPEAPPQTRVEKFAARVAQTESAMSQLSAAGQAIDDARPAYTPVDEETARRWYAELRATAARLMAHAEEFAVYYPDATTCATKPGSAP